ncbi:MAG TPA: polyhydroxyalkanoic acid system family protein [Stenotrophomonas sp.]
MSQIDIQHPHKQPPEQARVAIEEAAQKLQARFGVRSQWQGERLLFNGSGVDGAIELLPGAVHVTASLGFLLSAMKGMVEAEIRRVLSEKLD